MLGYWKNNRNPLTTTGNDFLENFVFLTPRYKLLFWFLAIGIPFVWLTELINPTYKYEFSDYHNYLLLEYHKTGDKVTGHIIYIFAPDGTRCQLDTDFKGTINNHEMLLELDNNSCIASSHTHVIKNFVGPQGPVNKNISITVNDSTITFMNIIAPKI